MKQEIKKIHINQLHLWTENPRDPMDVTLSDIDIIKNAIKDPKTKWILPSLLKEMGEHYDFSEIPTVVEKNGKNIVYDGNRRLAVLKYLQNKEIYQDVSGKIYFPTFEPEELVNLKEIYCNVCDKETALDNIERKHAKSGSWTILDRDYFLHKHRNKAKSLFLMFEEATGLVSSNEILNKRFVKDDILTKENLLSIGFKIKNNKLISMYQRSDTKEILNILIELIETGKINTRNDQVKGSIRVKRGGELKSVIEKLSPDVKGKIAKFDDDKKQDEFSDFAFQKSEEDSTSKQQRKGRQIVEENVFFGGKLNLANSKVQNLYSAIDDIYDKFKDSRFFVNKLPLLGMSLRLLLDVASREIIGIDDDQAYKKLLKKAKSEMGIKKEDENFLALTNSWLDGSVNMDGIFSKYAHGSIPVDKGNLMTLSYIVGDILKFYFNKKK